MDVPELVDTAESPAVEESTENAGDNDAGGNTGGRSGLPSELPEEDDGSNTGGRGLSEQPGTVPPGGDVQLPPGERGAGGDTSGVGGVRGPLAEPGADLLDLRGRHLQHQFIMNLHDHPCVTA